jgi:hypothetical protein
MQDAGEVHPLGNGGVGLTIARRAKRDLGQLQDGAREGGEFGDALELPDLVCREQQRRQGGGGQEPCKDSFRGHPKITGGYLRKCTLDSVPDSSHSLRCGSYGQPQPQSMEGHCLTLGHSIHWNMTLPTLSRKVNVFIRFLGNGHREQVFFSDPQSTFRSSQACIPSSS